MEGNRQRFINIYSSYFPEEFAHISDSTNEVAVKAFCHDDNHKSMSINVNNGAWYCFACDEGDDDIAFIQRYEEEVNNNKLTFPQAKQLADKLGGVERNREAIIKQEQEKQRPTISQTKIDTWHKMLLRDQDALKLLYQTRGINKDTIKRYQIGFDMIDRYLIPVYNERGECINVRRYNPLAKDMKMLSYDKGYGATYLYPAVEIINNDTIMLCEGEMDALIANQLGIPAITLTGGANSTIEPFKECFRDKSVYICYDVDNAGKKGAVKVAHTLMDVVESIKIISLPIDDIPNGDLTDYIVKKGHTKEDLIRLMEQADELKGADVDLSGAIEVTLEQSNNVEYQDQRIKMKVIVAGRDSTPYKVPRKVNFACKPNPEKCMGCPLFFKGEAGLTLEIDRTDRNILGMIEVEDTKQKNVLKEVAGIRPTCKSCQVEPETYWKVEQLSLIPDVDAMDMNNKHIIMTVYAVGIDGIETNRSYVMYGKALSNPKTQKSVHLVDEAVPSQNSIEMFEMTPDKYERLKVFQTDDVKSKFDEIYSDLERNVTKVYGRRDIHIGVDLIYHSVLNFQLESRVEKRGWVEGLILGDTRTGKSETVLRLYNHYRLGEFLTAENSSFAGLVGGMQKNGRDGWIITWGKIPLNDKRLVIIDEMSGLKEQEIELMSGIRSSGVAEITKIQTEKTLARTRLLWVSNDRDGKGLAKYSYGTDALTRLVGKNEDISRFEFVVTASSDEVPMDIINTRESERAEIPHVYTSELCRELIAWAWSRKMEDVVFLPETIDELYLHAKQMGKFYSSKVPLVESANQRIKLARLAVAVACRVFSTEDGENVIVKPEHVRFVREYLDTLYAKKSLGYKEFSMIERQYEKRMKRNRSRVEDMLNRTDDLAEVLSQMQIITDRELETMLGVDISTARQYIKELMRYGMLTKDRHGWVNTPEFNVILRKWLLNNMEYDEDDEDME